MSQECDALEEQNQKIDRKIERYEDISNLNKRELTQKVIQMRDETDTLRKRIELTTEECTGVQDEYDDI